MIPKNPSKNDYVLNLNIERVPIGKTDQKNSLVSFLQSSKVERSYK